MIHYNYTVTKVSHDDFKEGEVYLCDNQKEVSTSSTGAPREITLCKCTQVDEDFTDFTDFKMIKGQGELTDWLYQRSDNEFYDFYLVSKEKHPEEFL